MIKPFTLRVSTLRAAIELKGVFDQIQAAEKAGNLSPEEKRKLEEQAAEKGLQALFKASLVPLSYCPPPKLNLFKKGTKLEIESVLREVCDRILTDPAVPRDKAQLRAVALQMLGEAYVNVKKDVPNPNPAVNAGTGDDSEYVRIDTKGSRAKEGRS